MGALTLFGIEAWPEPDALGWAIIEAGHVFVTGSVVLSIFMCCISVLFPYRADRDGIRGYTLWGWPAQARWADIAEVSSTHSQGIPYLMIKRRSARSLILICDELHQQQEFDNLVAALISDKHPLHDWILPEEAISPGASGQA